MNAQSVVVESMAAQTAGRGWLLPLTLVLSAAILVRLAFFNGLFGSDEVTYLARSIDVSTGAWSSSDYNGGLRYGFNIPSGLLISLFGLNLSTANLWPLICSLIEIAGVFLFAWHYIGRRAAILSALVLVLLPLHVAVATRLHADPVVSMFLSMCFMLLYAAERSGKRLLYFLSGLCLGGVYWTKELAAITFLAFLFYPFIVRKMDRRWIYVVWGGLLMLVGHFALMQVIAGNPFHAIQVVLGQVQSTFVSQGLGEDSPWYYIRYLLIDIKHTWLVGWFALATVVILVIHKRQWEGQGAVWYVAFWLGALLLVLSVLPVSLSPLRFAMKQSNYLTLVLAPLAILAGVAMSRLRGGMGTVLVVLFMVGGGVLSAFEQQAYQVFTANSRALVSYAGSQSDTTIYASTNNANMVSISRMLSRAPKDAAQVFRLPPEGINPSPSGSRVTYALIDRETMGWGSKDTVLRGVPSCWRKAAELTPADLGNGHVIVMAVMRLSTLLPDALKSRVQMKLNDLLRPAPALLYLIDEGDMWCTVGGETAQSLSPVAMR